MPIRGHQATRLGPPLQPKRHRCDSRYEIQVRPLGWNSPIGLIGKPHRQGMENLPRARGRSGLKMVPLSLALVSPVESGDQNQPFGLSHFYACYCKIRKVILPAVQAGNLILLPGRIRAKCNPRIQLIRLVATARYSQSLRKKRRFYNKRNVISSEGSSVARYKSF